jgi:PAS domain S-box-containing protein
MTGEKQVHILYMEDDPGLAVLFRKNLERAGYRVDVTNDSREGLSMAESCSYDIVAVDHKMPNYSGLDVIRILPAKDNCPPLIMITGTGSEEIAVEAMKTGAADYIIKDPDGYYLELLPSLIEKVLNRQKIMEEKNRAEAALRDSEEKHRNLVERANDGIAIVMDGLIKFVNRRIEIISGYCREELIGRTFAEFIDSGERSRITDNYMRRLSGENIESIYETAVKHKNGRKLEVEFNIGVVPYEGREAVMVIIRDITERKRVEEERERLISQLQKALSDVKKLSGLLPICASCKKIRDDKGYWNQIESYIRDHSEAEFSHSICPDCMKKLYPDFYERQSEDKED